MSTSRNNFYKYFKSWYKSCLSQSVYTTNIYASPPVTFGKTGACWNKILMEITSTKPKHFKVTTGVKA